MPNPGHVELLARAPCEWFPGRVALIQTPLPVSVVAGSVRGRLLCWNSSWCYSLPLRSRHSLAECRLAGAVGGGDGPWLPEGGQGSPCALTSEYQSQCGMKQEVRGSCCFITLPKSPWGSNSVHQSRERRGSSPHHVTLTLAWTLAEDTIS